MRAAKFWQKQRLQNIFVANGDILQHLTLGELNEN